MIWSKIKKAINSTLGTKDFKPLDKIVEDSFSEVVKKQNEIKSALETGENDFIAGFVKNGANIVTGVYNGTGTYGISNPNSLVLPFTPKMVYVKLVKYYYYSLSPTMGTKESTEYAEQGTNIDNFLWFDGMERLKYSEGYGESHYSYYMAFSPTESGFSWYVRDPYNKTLRDTDQLNGCSYEEYNKEGKLTHKEEYTYAYIAIG